ncbi:nucleic acid/nucleotide deaminase domain-containing protein [Streptomyces sirii]|uniref:nucleic acid/nucleotide deaminase domain-containing protein n=1 Tax=Streptomyces sirii TaxID=3127701 RepID=UPI003D35F0AF
MPDAEHTPDERADATREDRNESLPDPEPKDQELNSIPPDASQEAVRDAEGEGQPVYRIDPLDPVYDRLREWCEPPTDGEGHPVQDKDGNTLEPPLAQLLRLAAERRAASEAITEPANQTRKVLDGARQKLNAAQKALNDAGDKATKAQQDAVKNAQAEFTKADQDHRAASEDLKNKKDQIPPTAFTESELRHILGDNFAAMNDGERHVVVATIARMSMAFHADNAVGNGPTRTSDGESPYKGSTTSSGQPDPAGDHHDSVGSRRRAEAQPKFPAKFRPAGSDSATAFKRVQDESRQSGEKATIKAILEKSFPNIPDFTDKNYAVVELVDKDGNSSYVVDSSVPPMGTDGVSPRHSEKHLLDWVKRLNEARDKDDQLTVAGLYTEREPCGLRTTNPGNADCSKTLRDALGKGIPVYYSTTYRDDSVRLKEDLHKQRDALLSQFSNLDPDQQQNELKKAKLTDKDITDRVQQRKDRNKEKNDAELGRHLTVVGELWGKTRAHMIRIEREKKQAEGTG